MEINLIFKFFKNKKWQKFVTNITAFNFKINSPATHDKIIDKTNETTDHANTRISLCYNSAVNIVYCISYMLILFVLLCIHIIYSFLNLTIPPSNRRLSFEWGRGSLKSSKCKKNQKIKKNNENITTATSIWVKQFFNPVILFLKII